VVAKSRMFEFKPDGEVTIRMQQDAHGLPAPLMQVRILIFAAVTQHAKGKVGVPRDARTGGGLVSGVGAGGCGCTGK
jgi:hypothetical protein